MNRRSDLVARLADHVLAHGLGAASLRPLAAAVGTSDRMLLYYFPDKAALVAAVLEEVAGRMTAFLEAGASPLAVSPAALEFKVLPLLLDEALWPYMQLWLEIAAKAARGDPTCASVGEAIARGFVARLAAQLDLPEPAARAQAAIRLLATIEGAVLLKSLGLGAEVATMSGPG